MTQCPNTVQQLEILATGGWKGQKSCNQQNLLPLVFISNLFLIRCLRCWPPCREAVQLSRPLKHRGRVTSWAEPLISIKRFKTHCASISMRGACEDFQSSRVETTEACALVHSAQLLCSVSARFETPTPSDSCREGEKGTPTPNTPSV